MKRSENQQLWIEETLEKIKIKMVSVAERNQDKIPYTAKNGIFNDYTDEKIYWWTNGFWAGIMWQMYHLSGEERFKEIAVRTEEKMDKNFLMPEKLDHDNGFKWLPSAVANYRITGSQESKSRGLLAAELLAGRYNPAGHFLRAWNEWGGEKHLGWAIIDCMMNLPLLYWAWEETKDPRFRHIAVNHADMAQTYFVRPDGSVNHIVEFNPETGEMIKSRGGQGYEDGSSWTRGQSWGIYGFVLSYVHTQNESYLNTAKIIANYFIANIPESNLIPVDFMQPETCSWEDSTAAACAASGMIELSRYVKEAEKHVYLDAAIRLLKALYEKRCSFSPDIDNLLENCSAAYHDTRHNFPMIYADYYFIEAILKLADKELFIW
ncbi:glycoside hydrolase family 88 protein [Clostridium sp. E02]|uniref:glycoside hydrolase family 88 protein n=1 Tax=Clostridium sp. E02 TaxID=2487134 RepID=UPI000F52F45C|nr:glycoside hydrolase family 88 protein [Clostridium sp. E02]